MKYDIAYIEKIFADMIEDKLPLREWGDFVSIRTSDDFSKYWSKRARDIEFRFADPKNGILISDEGIKEMKKILVEIRELRAK